MGKNSKPSKRSAEDDGRMGDWVTALVARQQAATTAEHHHLHPTSKAQRIEKRLAKKQRREERKLMHSHPRKVSSQEEKDTAVAVVEHRRKVSVEKRRTTSGTSNEDTTASSARTNKNDSKRHPHRQTDRLLKDLSQKVQECVASINQKQDDNGDLKTKKWPKPYVPAPPSSKKRKRRQQQQDAAYWQQPRKSDYGGIGLARASLWIDLQDPSHQPKLVQEFQEHVPGFFGKQRTKAMKKQLDGNMLWRQLLQQKRQQQDNSGSTSKKKKKEKAKSPDERVEAMIQAGVL